MTPHLIPVLQQCLDDAGAVLMKHYGRLESYNEKSNIDLVTAADVESEGVIKRIIGSAFPSHQILAEESGEDFGGKDADYRWIVDPLDGTTNFAHSCPIFSISIAVEKAGAVVAAGVRNPHTNETFLAEAGSGTTLNGSKINVSKTEKLSHSLMVTGFPYDRRKRLDHYLGICGKFLMHSHGLLRLGSAAMDLAFVAAGRLDGFWEENLNPWDTAAGWLLVEEAGGRVTNFGGAAYSPYNKAILATNGAIHQQCVDLIGA
jgi:myo-inositol-1(or 4)-monophosphatase